MTKKIEEAVAQFNKAMAEEKVTYLLIYSYQNVIKGTNDTRMASNIGQVGIRAILSAILRPTQQTIAILARAFEDVARAGIGITKEGVEASIAEGTFVGIATTVFDHIRGHFTIEGWTEQSKPS